MLLMRFHTFFRTRTVLVSILSLFFACQAVTAQPAKGKSGAGSSKSSISPKGIPPAKAQTGYALLDTALLSAHLNFLANDLMEGRETGKRGQKMASRYIAAQFQRLGLKPIGDNGTYFQHFWVKERKVGRGNQLIIDKTMPGKADPKSKTPPPTTRESEVVDRFFHDFFFLPTRNFNPKPVITGSVVFLGFGINDAAKYNYDDYAGQSVEGKVVLLMPGEPEEMVPSSRFDGLKPTKWSEYSTKYTAAVQAKAAAVLQVADLGNDTTRRFFEMFQPYHDYVSISSMELTAAPGAEGAPSTPKPNSVPLIFISRSVADALLKHSGKSIVGLYQSISERATPQSFEIPNTSIALNFDLQENILQSENVCGILEGSDKTLKQEAVIFTSHYDHVGMTLDGEVFNGADDDGSGTATVLALAEAFAKNKLRSKRSIIFMTVSGEEKGLLGSKYYTDHPTFPLSSTYANINIDMVGRIDSTKYEKLGIEDYIYVIGSDKISKDLDDALQRQNAASVNLTLDYTYNDDNDPNRFYYRSDHYNFAKNGIPIVFFFDGLHADYHKTTDDVEKINFPRMAKVAKLAFSLGWELTMRKEPLRDNDEIK